MVCHDPITPMTHGDVIQVKGLDTDEVPPSGGWAILIPTRKFPVTNHATPEHLKLISPFKSY